MKTIKLMLAVMMIPIVAYPSDDVYIVTQGNGNEVILSEKDLNRMATCKSNCRIIIHTSDKTIDIRVDGNGGVRSDE